MQSPPTITLIRQAQPEAPPRSTRAPSAWSILRTLDISARYILADLLGRGGVAYADGLLQGWARDVLRSGNCSLTASGLEVFETPPPFVIMSNHASLLDIPVVMLAVPHTVRMVAKQELTRLPIWGPAMRRSGFVPISRGDRARAIAQLEVAKAQLAAGVSIWISPEGTRSRDGQLRPLKKGGFHLAIDLGVPILPAFIEGAYEVLPPGTFVVNTGRAMHISFGVPIPTQGVGPAQLPDLMAEVDTQLRALRDRRTVAPLVDSFQALIDAAAREPAPPPGSVARMRRAFDRGEAIDGQVLELRDDGWLVDIFGLKGWLPAGNGDWKVGDSLQVRVLKFDLDRGVLQLMLPPG